MVNHGRRRLRLWGLAAAIVVACAGALVLTLGRGGSDSPRSAIQDNAGATPEKALMGKAVREERQRQMTDMLDKKDGKAGSAK